MPPLLVIAAAGAGAYLAYRAVKTIAAQSVGSRGDERVPQKAEAAPPKDLGTLKQDPDTAEYRPQ